MKTEFSIQINNSEILRTETNKVGVYSTVAIAALVLFEGLYPQAEAGYDVIKIWVDELPWYGPYWYAWDGYELRQLHGKDQHFPG